MPIICLVGPTGTGKTALAVALSQKLDSALIVSADSRQVYRGMDIVTGKDHPAGVEICGIDIANPDESCSVSHWLTQVEPQISRAIEHSHPIIVVGGTGFYLRALTHGIGTVSVPINQQLRDQLAKSSVSALKSQLEQLDPLRFRSMNNSDANNPRRLIRAIEVVLSPVKARSNQPLIKNYQMIGLRYFDNLIYRQEINQRVQSRIKQGAIQETAKLLSLYGSGIQSMSALGYRSIIKYLEGSFTQEELADTWTQDELSYSKRQLTYFNRQNVTWYDRGKINYREVINDIIQSRDIQ